MFGKGRKQVRLNDAVKHHSIATPILPCSNSLLIRGWFSHGIPHEQKVSYLLCVKKIISAKLTDKILSSVLFYLFPERTLIFPENLLNFLQHLRLFLKRLRFSESTNIVLNHIREMKYSSMILWLSNRNILIYTFIRNEI